MDFFCLTPNGIGIDDRSLTGSRAAARRLLTSLD
jgi:hypothetical protein